MAGTSKAYWRKKGTPTKTVVTHTFGDGSQITYNQYDLYTYNPGNYPVVDQTTGVCTSRPGSDSEYFGQERAGHPAGGGPGRTNESYTDETQDYESFSGDAPGDSTTGTTKTIKYKQYTGGHAGHQVDHPNTAISDKPVGSH